MFALIRIVLLLIVALALLLYFRPDLAPQLGFAPMHQSEDTIAELPAPAQDDSSAAAAEADRIIDEALNYREPDLIPWDDSALPSAPADEPQAPADEDARPADAELEWRPTEIDTDAVDAITDEELLLDAIEAPVFAPLEENDQPAATTDSLDLDAMQDALQIERAIQHSDDAN